MLSLPLASSSPLFLLLPVFLLLPTVLRPLLLLLTPLLSLVLLVPVLLAPLTEFRTSVEMAMVYVFQMERAHWPICSVLSSSVLAVFMTSTLFW